MTRMDDDEARQRAGVEKIPGLARAYARNRTLPVVVSLLIFAAGSAVFGGLSCLMVWAYVRGDRVLAGASVVALCGFGVWWLWFCLYRSGRTIQRISDRWYRSVGTVVVAPEPDAELARPPLTAAAFGLLFCVVATIGLGLLGFFPRRYLQPITAIYVVPFLVYVGFRVGHVGSSLMFLWPALYGAHAILLAAGAPIYFGGHYEILNVFVPVVGYGLVAALAGHLYGRLVLRRLREAAAAPDGSRDGGAAAGDGRA